MLFGFNCRLSSGLGSSFLSRVFHRVGLLLGLLELLLHFLDLGSQEDRRLIGCGLLDNDGRLAVAFLDHVFEQPVVQGLISLGNAIEKKQEHDDYQGHQTAEEDAQSKHPLARLVLFGVNVLLEGL